jgi:hypothetical protein
MADPVETHGLPRPMYYAAISQSLLLVAALGGYLLYRNPRPGLIAIPFVLAAGVAASCGVARWSPAGNRKQGYTVMPIFLGVAYIYPAIGWSFDRWNGLIVGLVMGIVPLVYTFIVLVLKGPPSPEDMALTPVDRNPNDWRWTTPS